MCFYWNPITAAELAALPSVRLETNVVSAQLDRLTRDGVVEKAPTPPGEKLLYQVSERFFNIWYLMRAGRRLRRKLIWLVDFLKIFYVSADLYERASRFLKSEPIARRAEMAFAYAQTVDEPALRHALEYEGIRSMLSEHREYRKVLGAILDFEADDVLLKTHAERIADLHEIKQRILNVKINWQDCTAEEFWQRLGGSWALSLEEKKHIADRLDTLAEQEIREVLKNVDRKQRRLSALLGPKRLQILMEARRSGDMADVTDVEGADAAVIRLSAPSLKAIAHIELARMKPSPLPINDIEEIRQVVALDTDYVYPPYSLGRFLADHPDLCHEAEACYRKALEIFTNHPYLWDGLGDLLSEHLKRYDEAETAYRKAIELGPNDDEYLNSLAWFLFLTDKNIEEAEEKARQALVISPDDLDIIHTLACILARRAKWEEAALMARRFIVEGDEDYHSTIWPDIVSFFKEAVKTGHAADAIALLDDIGYEDRWRPLREALRAIAAGSDAPLLRVAPEIRQPAEELVAQLLPEGVTLASAIKTPRVKRPRRKKTV